MKITLDHPVQHGETTYQSVTLRRAKAKDMVTIAAYIPALSKLAPEGGEVDVSSFDGKVVEAMIVVVATLGDMPEEAVAEFDFADLMEATSKATDFLSFEKSPGGG